MARPRKENAQYFSHDCNMWNDARVKALRRRFGDHQGYAMWCRMLEVLTDKNNFKFEIRRLDLEIMAESDFSVEIEKLNSFINYAVQIELLQMETINEKQFIFCTQLNQRMEVLLEKRSRDRERYDKNNTVVSASENSRKPQFPPRKLAEMKEFPPRKPAKTLVSASENPSFREFPRVSASENTQSKVKENKEKKKRLAGTSPKKEIASQPADFEKILKRIVAVRVAEGRLAGKPVSAPVALMATIRQEAIDSDFAELGVWKEQIARFKKNLVKRLRAKIQRKAEKRRELEAKMQSDAEKEMTLQAERIYHQATPTEMAILDAIANEDVPIGGRYSSIMKQVKIGIIKKNGMKIPGIPVKMEA